MFDIVKKCVDFVYHASTHPAMVDPLETLEAGLSYVLPKRERIRSPSVATSSARSRIPGKATLLTTGLGPKREERRQKLQKTTVEDAPESSQEDGSEGVEQPAFSSPGPKAKTNTEAPDPRVEAEDSKKQKKTSLKETQAQAQRDGIEGVEQTTSRSRKRKAKNNPEAPDDAEGSKKRKKTSEKATQTEPQGDGAEDAKRSRKRKAKTPLEASDRKRKAKKTPDDAEGSKSRTDYEPPVSEKPRESRRKAHRHRPPELSDFQVAYKWFHLVRRMVMKEKKSDYILECAFMPYALVVMVYQGWIDLIEVLGWKDARHLLGKGLVKLSTEHDAWKKLQVLADVAKPSEQETEDFQRDWTISTNPENAYDSIEDASDWRQHGPFGPALARYATPDVLEEVLEMQFREGVQLDKVELPGNWKSLFLPLFLRKQKPREATNEQEHQEEPEDDGGKRRARQTTVEDAPEDDYVGPRLDGGNQEDPILEGSILEGPILEVPIVEEPIVEEPIVEVRENKVDPASPPPTVVDPANQSIEMRADEVQTTFTMQPDAVNGALHDNVWANVNANQPEYPAFQAYEAASFPTDVRMEEEVIQQQPPSHGEGVDNSQADSDMSFDFTGPPQTMEPQLGAIPEVSSVTGPGGDASNYGTYMSAGKRVKYIIDTSQASQPQLSQSHASQPQFSHSHTPKPQPSQTQTPFAQAPISQAPQAQAQAPISHASQAQAQASLAPQPHTTEARPTQTYTTSQPRTSSISPSAPNPARRGARHADQGRLRQRPRDRHRSAASSNAASNSRPYDPLVAALAGIPKPNFG